MTFPVFASIITIALPPPTNRRWLDVSIAMPVGLSAGATGQVATTLRDAMSMTSTASLSSMLTNTRPRLGSVCPVSAEWYRCVDGAFVGVDHRRRLAAVIERINLLLLRLVENRVRVGAGLHLAQRLQR